MEKMGLEAGLEPRQMPSLQAPVPPYQGVRLRNGIGRNTAVMLPPSDFSSLLVYFSQTEPRMVVQELGPIKIEHSKCLVMAYI